MVPLLMVSDGVVSGWAGHCAWRVSPRLTTFLPACWSAVSIWVSGSVMSVFAVSGCVGVGFAAEGAGWFVASSVLVVAGFGAVSDGALPGFGLSSFSA